MKTREKRYTSYVMIREKNIAEEVSYKIVCEVDSGTDANKKAVELAATNPGVSYVAANVWPAIMAKEIKKVIFVDPDNPNDTGKDSVEIDEDEGDTDNGGTDTKKDKDVAAKTVVAPTPAPSAPPAATKSEPPKSEPPKSEPPKSEPAKAKKKDAEPAKKDEVKSSGGDESFLSLFNDSDKKGAKKDEEPAGFVNKDEAGDDDEEKSDDSKTTIPSLF